MDSPKVVRRYVIKLGVLSCECFLVGHCEPFISFDVVLKDGLFKMKKTDCSLLVLRDEINVCLAMCEQILSKD